ncbi:MAG: winged helix-turn-helix domain-containing protein [Candidatus ainarchaeum sp.]|nr:winged helix-turn-helix domain-containing protein [Candidatus ainarchaeum sp.]
MNSFERIFYWLFVGSKGGRNRARILLRLMKEPLNSNKLSEALRLDYKTIQHHLDLLEENGVIEWSGKKYGKVYFPSMEFESNKKTLLPLVKKVIEDEQ